MAVAGNIPLPDPSKWGDFSDILQQMMQNKLKSQELAETGKYHQGELENKRQELLRQAKNDQQLNSYRMGELGLQQKLEPLKTDLLRSQIESQKQLAKQRIAQANMTSGLTKTNVSRNQAIIQAIDNVSPLIDSLKESDFPGQTVGKYFSPNEQAAYRAKTATITDSLLGALGLPKTNESLSLISTMVTQHPFESRGAYKTRLEGLTKDLSERKERARSSIKEGLFSNQDSSENQDPLGLL